MWAGLLSSGTGLTMALTAPLWGHVADRYSRKLMVQRAMFGGAVVLSSMAYVQSAGQLLSLRIVQGGITGTVSASIALVSSVAPRAAMGFALGMMQTAVFVGNSIGPYLGGKFAESYGYRTPFLVTGGMLLAGGVLVLFGAKERFTRPTQEHENGGTLREVLATPGLRPLLVVFTMMNLSGSFVGPIFPLFVEQVTGAHDRAAASATGLLLMVMGFAGALAAVVGGRLSDRYGQKRVLIACTILTGLVCFPHVAARNLGDLIWLRVLAGLGAGGTMPAMNAMIAATVPRHSLGKAYGLTTTASALGWGMGPFLGGVAAAQFGLRVPFAIMGCLLLCMALVAQRAVKQTKSPGP